ncbi:thermonuclease family protein [Rhodosalinus sediminis]|uniref:thermonuclease family protein n=1 Tax=Rhodosalinus sediminis TaxID=1940533 RepID=UPI002352202A|nr:thermonuclease family protein [Rhodosalinus sediminis]
MTISGRVCAVLVAALVLGGATAEARQIDGTAYVRDADTIVVAGTPVRLNGIDAPETSTRYGRAAKAFMARLLRGEQVVCDLNGERTYDRWVGTCYISVDGQWTDVGAIVVANGHALDCRRYSGGRYRSLEPAGARSRLPQAGYC